MQKYRPKKKKKEKDRKREQTIKEFMKAGLTREEAIQVVEDDAKL